MIDDRISAQPSKVSYGLTVQVKGSRHMACHWTVARCVALTCTGKKLGRARP